MYTRDAFCVRHTLQMGQAFRRAGALVPVLLRQEDFAPLIAAIVVRNMERCLRS